MYNSIATTTRRHDVVFIRGHVISKTTPVSRYFVTEGEIYGCCTIGDDWTFLRAVVTGTGSDLPSMTAETSREYKDQHRNNFPDLRVFLSVFCVARRLHSTAMRPPRALKTIKNPPQLRESYFVADPNTTLRLYPLVASAARWNRPTGVQSRLCTNAQHCLSEASLLTAAAVQQRRR